MDLPSLFTRKVSLAHGMALAFVILVLDGITGPNIHFPILFFLPVVLVTWQHHLVPGVGMAVALPALRAGYFVYCGTPLSSTEMLINAAIQSVAMVILALLVDRLSVQTLRIRVLESFLPICSFCKKIRNDRNEWEQLESYISKRSDTRFSHGVCPECAEREYRGFLKQSKRTVPEEGEG
jgi:hypothetical protein